MQNTAIYNPSFKAAVVTAAGNTPWMSRAARSLRTLAHRWDMIGVLGLMASSAVYGVYALAGTSF